MAERVHLCARPDAVRGLDHHARAMRTAVLLRLIATLLPRVEARQAKKDDAEKRFGIRREIPHAPQRSLDGIERA